ncbi:hypothetical protein BKA67DRAFT_153956 [Truncatella angustata]|uniref:F-box domain-containing protein n=1 Tax=Truncatella angustata TaxID=152316 RepID=A0A9P8UQR1_9PEZI|nr:uncharacterized protein BKA67DRAFT_153956 [Truncatella angustata]KAH6656377.1 hypothetical protein BKA67DRAFT_153956 [Truncatella angustata]KAH8198537.1 hypothetical protein TruAng_007316 [Truncatella angustata]
MEDHLSQALGRLVLAGGEPDPQARKEALCAFVQCGHLNVNEFRLLKELLSTVTLQKDIVPNLPVELVILITDYLNERDIWSCLTVSHGWKTTFMSDRIVFSLADRLFPQLTWKVSQDALQNDNTRAELRLRFLYRLRKRLSLMKRSASGAPRQFEGNYLWESESNFKLDEQDYSQFASPNLPFNQKTLYANGRIAWQRETHTVVIDDLRNRSRKILSHPGGKLLGPEMKLAALGIQLAVATMNRYIFAWNIESGRSERRILPSLPERCTTFGNRIAIITNEEIYFWDMGSPLVAMALPDLSIALLAVNTFPKAFVHPHRDNVLYARQVYRSSSYTLRFMVHKYVDRKHVETFDHDVAMSWLPNERFTSSLMGFIPISHEWDQQTDGYCLYEFDMYHEKFLKRDISHCGRRHNDSFMFTFDDDFAVELSERQYWVW